MDVHLIVIDALVTQFGFVAVDGVDVGAVVVVVVVVVVLVVVVGAA